MIGAFAQRNPFLPPLDEEDGVVAPPAAQAAAPASRLLSDQDIGLPPVHAPANDGGALLSDEDIGLPTLASSHPDAARLVAESQAERARSRALQERAKATNENNPGEATLARAGENFLDAFRQGPTAGLAATIAQTDTAANVGALVTKAIGDVEANGFTTIPQFRRSSLADLYALREELAGKSIQQQADNVRRRDEEVAARRRFEEMPPAETFAGKAAATAGYVGGLLADPLNLVGPAGAAGKNLATRMVTSGATQGAVNAGVEAAVEGMKEARGVEPASADNIFAAAGLGFLIGSALPPVGAAAKGIAGYIKAKFGKAPEALSPPEQEAVRAAVDGGDPDVSRALAEAGYRPDQFSSPDAAARAADRIQRRRGLDDEGRTDLTTDDVARFREPAIVTEADPRTVRAVEDEVGRRMDIERQAEAGEVDPSNLARPARRPDEPIYVAQDGAAAPGTRLDELSVGRRRTDELQGEARQEADDAFRVAEARRRRYEGAVSTEARTETPQPRQDMAAGGRPEGAARDEILMVGDTPVQVVGRTADGRLIVDPYDPRTGESLMDSRPFPVRDKDVTTRRWSPTERQAQDFEARAQTPPRAAGVDNPGPRLATDRIASRQPGGLRGDVLPPEPSARGAAEPPPAGPTIDGEVRGRATSDQGAPRTRLFADDPAPMEARGREQELPPAVDDAPPTFEARAEVNGQVVGSGPVDATKDLSDLRALSSKKKLPDELRAPPSLADFVRSSGGIKEDGTYAGDLRSIGSLAREAAGTRGRKVGIINKGGMSLDDMTLAAWEAGYFPEHAERPSPSVLVEALREDFGGRPQYSTRDLDRVERLQRLRQTEEEVASVAPDWRKMKPAEVNARLSEAASIEEQARLHASILDSIEDEFARLDADARARLDAAGDAFEPDVFYDGYTYRTLQEYANAGRRSEGPRVEGGARRNADGEQPPADAGGAGAGTRAGREGEARGGRSGEGRPDTEVVETVDGPREQFVLPAEGFERGNGGAAAKAGTEAPMRGKGAQKEPGSDGGLFDQGTGKQADIFGRSAGAGDRLVDEVLNDPEAAKALRNGLDGPAGEVKSVPHHLNRSFHKVVHKTAALEFGSPKRAMAEKVVAILNDPEARAVAARKLGVADRAAQRGDDGMTLGALGDWGKVARTLKGVGEGTAWALEKTLGRVLDLGFFKELMRDGVWGAGRAVWDAGRTAILSNDTILRRIARDYRSPTLTKLADMFHARAGADDATGRTFQAAVNARSTRNIRRAMDLMGDLVGDAKAEAEIRDLVVNPKRNAGKTRNEQIAAEIGRLLKEELEYRRAAGEDIGDVPTGYFPRILDDKKVSADELGFKRAVARLYRAAGNDAEAARHKADALFDRVIMQGHGIDSLDLGFQVNPTAVARTAKEGRVFGRDADNALRDFYNDNVFDTLVAYFNGSARSAEYTRRFGVRGAENSAERKAWVKEHGEGTTQLEVMERAIRDEIRASERDPAGVMGDVSKILASNLGTLGANTSRKARALVSGLHTWNILATMDRSLLTSISELGMIGMRTGSVRAQVKGIAEGLKEYGRAVAKAEPSEARRWAESLGLVNDAIVETMLQSRVSGLSDTRLTSKINAGFFKAITLHQWTEGTRVAAVTAGREFILNLAHDVEKGGRKGQRAAFYLKELGVQDPAAFGAWMKSKSYAPDMTEVMRDAGAAGEYGTALVRFVDQTIMNPTRADKPRWASHPIGSLFYGLMSFTYAFQKNVLAREARLIAQAVRDKDPSYVAGLAIGAPVMLAITAAMETSVRPVLFGKSDRAKEETPAQTALKVVDRAGLTGILSPLVNAVTGLKYERDLATSGLGPALGSSAEGVGSVLSLIPKSIGGKNAAESDTAERKAVRTLYRLVVDPVIDAAGAGGAKGLARSAIVYGTGHRRDEDAFVEGVSSLFDWKAEPKRGEGGGRGERVGRAGRGER